MRGLSKLISSNLLLKFLEENNFSTITGVPCSYFKDLLNYLDKDYDHIELSR